jgi:hypothetical protein
VRSSTLTKRELLSSVKLIVSILLAALALTACAKTPSPLACEVWEDARKEAGTFVDFWAKYPISSLTLEEKINANEAIKLYSSVLREMDAIGCKY